MVATYRDSLLAIENGEIRFFTYYLPFGSKIIHISEIEQVEVRPPSVWDGSWRFWGSTGFFTWFPLDWRRPSRDRLFFLTQRNRRIRIGFTAEDGARVEEIFREFRVLHVP